MTEFFYRGPDLDTALERLECAPVLAVDTETVNLKDHTCIGIGIYIADDEGFYFPTYPEPDENLPLVMYLLSDPERTKVYHNGQNFDLPVLDKLAREEGWNPPDDVNYQDTAIMANVGGLPGSLERLGKEWLGFKDLFSIKDLFELNKTNSMLDVPTDQVAQKCLNDCRTTWKLYHWLPEQTNSRAMECYEVDRQLIHGLRTIEPKGLALRPAVLREYDERLRRALTEIRAECDAEGFNPGSPQQVGIILASRGNILPFTKNKRGLQTSERVLLDVEDPLAETILDYRGKAKLLNSYIQPWLEKDRAYTHFRLDLATGRLASGKINAWDEKNRNLQNVPPDIREVFKPDSGIWTWADYSQVELRVLAFVSQDKVMMAEYLKVEPDLHSVTAQATGLSRSGGKTFNFAMVFGASDYHLSRTLKVPIEKVKHFKAQWKATFREANRFMDRQMYEHGEWVETAFGRRCRLPEPQPDAEYSPRRFEAHVQKCAVNYPVQGTAADIIKRAMLGLLKDSVDIRLQVHDELLVDGDYYFPDWINRIHPELYTPFETKKGPVWS